MSQVIIYCRKSTENGQTYSLEAQEAEIRAFCERSGLEVFQVFKDVSSGTDDHRRGLKLAVALATARKMPIVVLRIDRLSRKPSKIFSLLENPNLKVIVSELGLEADPFLLGQLALFSQLELTLLKRRTREGLRRAKERGVQLGNPRWIESVGARRAGAKRKADQQALRLKPIILPLYNQHGSYRKVAAALNELEIRTDRNKAFSHQLVKAVIERLTLNRSTNI